MSKDAAGPESQQAFRLEIAGELTIYRAAELKRALLTAVNQHRAIDVDLSNVIEIDLSGVQLLMLAKRTARAASKLLRMIEPSPAVQDVFVLLDLSAYFSEPAGRADPSGTTS